MTDSVSQGSSPSPLGKTVTPGGTRRRAAEVFEELEATRNKATMRPDSAKVKTEQRPAEPTPADLVEKARHAAGSDRGFAIERGGDGSTTLRMSGGVDPAVYASQKLAVPRQELRAYAKSPQQWALLVRSFETSVIQIQALIATKLKDGQISRGEAQEALRLQFAQARPDSAIPVLRFLGNHPEYKDVFGIQGDR